MHKGSTDTEHRNAWSELGSVDEHEYAAELLVWKLGDAVRVPTITKQPQHAKSWRG